MLLVKTAGKDSVETSELVTNMLKALAGKFMEIELKEESFDLGCQYLQLLAIIANPKIVASFVEQFLDITLAKIAVLGADDRADQYELLQKTLIDTFAAILVLQ